MAEPDPFARLPRTERDRLEAFALRLERTGLDVLLTLAARPLDPEAHAAARDAAKLAARDSARRPASEQVRADAREWVVRTYNRSTLQPGWYEANWGRPGTIEDRANLAEALADAFTALVVWDRLDEADRDELLGPFVALVDDAAAG